MQRRKALKNIGISFGAFIATPSAISLLQSCQTREPWLPVFFSEEQGQLIRDIVDVFLPSIDDLPSASEVNAHVFVDRFMNDVLESKDQEMVRGSLQVVIKSILSDSEKETVNKLRSSDYDNFFASTLKKTKEEHDSIQEQIGAHMAENESMDGLPDDVRTYSFLTSVRDMTIWAYKTNEMVGENVLAYKPVPGKQEGCVDLQETTGGRAWSL